MMSPNDLKYSQMVQKFYTHTHVLVRAHIHTHNRMYAKNWWTWVNGIKEFFVFYFNFYVNMKLYQNEKLPKN